MKFCKYCGEAIEDTIDICPKCRANFKENNNNISIVYNETAQTGMSSTISKESEFKKIIKRIIPFIQKYHKPIVAVLAAFCFIFIVTAITSIASKDYQECLEDYSEYMENYEENLAISNSYSRYSILGIGYKNIANGWKDLADDELAELWGMRVKAILFTVLGIACGFFAFKVYKIKDN